MNTDSVFYQKLKGEYRSFRELHIRAKEILFEHNMFDGRYYIADLLCDAIDAGIIRRTKSHLIVE